MKNATLRNVRSPRPSYWYTDSITKKTAARISRLKVRALGTCRNIRGGLYGQPSAHATGTAMEINRRLLPIPVADKLAAPFRLGMANEHELSRSGIGLRSDSASQSAADIGHGARGARDYLCRAGVALRTAGDGSLFCSGRSTQSGDRRG